MVINRTIVSLWTAMLMKAVAWGCGLSFLSVFALLLIVYGAKLDRRQPNLYGMRVVGEVHAGGHIPLVADWRNTTLCIPKYQRALVRDRDPLKNWKTQVITEAPGLGEHGETDVPMPRDVDGGWWYFMQRIQLSGCGAFSGIFSPLIAEGRDPQGQLGVKVFVLPYQTVPATLDH